MEPTSDRTLTEENVQILIKKLEHSTTIFYNGPDPQNPKLWQEAQAYLVGFLRITNPFEICTKILEKSRNSLVLYQTTLCLKNAVANDFKKFDMDELYKLFQFLYEFLCSQALENKMSVNEMTAFICAIILKRLASEKTQTLSFKAVIDLILPGPGPAVANEEDDNVSYAIMNLCANIKNPAENLSKKVASALILGSLLQECQMSNRSSLLGIRVWKHLNARRLIETRLKYITEVCLEYINWAFSSNVLNPANMTQEVQVLFHLVGTLIQCIEYSLSFNSTETACASGGDRVLRSFQSRAINMMSLASEHDQRLNNLREWSSLVMAPSVVQFLFNLYTTIKSMINCIPQLYTWDWPANILKNSFNCLYYLSDIHNYINLERNGTYAEFVGNLMLGAIRLMDTEVPGVDDSYQIASLITSISIHTSETRETITQLKKEHFIPFLDSAQRYTCKKFSAVASTTKAEVEEEEEKTVDTLLDFWYHLFRNINNEIRWLINTNSPLVPKVDAEGVKSYSRVIVESYISCHIHRPLGQLVPNTDDDAPELDLDQDDEQDDNNIHAQQLISFGMIARFDATHTAKILIELLGTRVTHFEALLTQFINSKDSPDGIKDWEYINDDLHWLLLMMQHYLTQTGYGETGFMCNEILNASVAYGASVQKTLEGFEKFDYSSPEVDPIVRLIIIVLKLCQIEMGICQSGKISWMSTQTNGTLTSLLSRFCLTYFYPEETDYHQISENMNYCFGQDAPAAEKFLKFVVEHTCCMIMYMRADQLVVKRNVQLLIQLLTIHPNVKKVMTDAEDTSLIKVFMAQLRPDNLTGFSPKVAKSIVKLATRLFVKEDDWNELIDFFNNKWLFIMSCIQNKQHQSEMVSSKFLEFCDFAMGVCEACDDETSERLLNELIVPIVSALPTVLQAFANFESVSISVFELLYNVVNFPMLNVTSWQSSAHKSFYHSCEIIIQTYARIAMARTNRGDKEEDCEDIVAVLTFCSEVMKKDWGNFSITNVVIVAMEKLGSFIKPEYLQLPRVRGMYYRLLVYLVDEDDRLASLSDDLMRNIVSSILLAINSQFDKDVDNHTYTIIVIICRYIYAGKGTEICERLARHMSPVLPALFKQTITQSSFTISAEVAELIAPAVFSLRCCYMDVYKKLIEDLIEEVDEPYAKANIKRLFENLEAKIHKMTLNRTSLREFNTLFVPFHAELHQLVGIK